MLSGEPESAKPRVKVWLRETDRRMIRGVLSLLVACAAVLAGPHTARGDIRSWGDNWVLDPGLEAGVADPGDGLMPLDVSARCWRTAWEDPDAGIESKDSGFYQVGVTTSVDRYRFALGGRWGRFSPQRPTRSFSGGRRLELEVSLGYRLLPILAAFGGWRIVRYSYTYETPESGESGPLLKAEPLYGGFEAGAYVAVPLGKHIVPYGRLSVCRLTAEGGYAPVTGDQSEWGVAVRPTGLPGSFLVCYRMQRLRTHDASVRGTNERFSGMVFGLCYVFAVEAVASGNGRKS